MGMEPERGRARRVLVVDDELSDRSWLIDKLESWGFGVYPCESWTAVTHLLFQLHKANLPFPDVALIDTHFKKPELGQAAEEGYHIIAGLKKHCVHYQRPRIPCIGFTMKLEVLDRERMFEAGAEDCITKPEMEDRRIAFPRLLNCIEKAVYVAA